MNPTTEKLPALHDGKPSKSRFSPTAEQSHRLTENASEKGSQVQQRRRAGTQLAVAFGLLESKTGQLEEETK